MTLDTVLEYALPIVLVLLAVVAVWLVVEMALTMRKTRSTMETLETQLKPTLEHVDSVTAALIPAVEKMDPLMERVNLSVDAVNLEIMRVDTILENAGEITKNLTEASEAATAVANAPQEAITQVTDIVRKALKPRAASDESMAIGERKAAAAKDAAKKPGTAEVFGAVRGAVSPVAEAVQDGRMQEAAEKKVAAAVEKINTAAKTVKGQAQGVAASVKSASMAGSVKIEEQAAVSSESEYFTYKSDALNANMASFNAKGE